MMRRQGHGFSEHINILKLKSVTWCPPPRVGERLTATTAGLLWQVACSSAVLVHRQLQKQRSVHAQLPVLLCSVCISGSVDNVPLISVAGHDHQTPSGAAGSEEETRGQALHQWGNPHPGTSSRIWWEQYCRVKHAENTDWSANSCGGVVLQIQ